MNTEFKILYNIPNSNYNNSLNNNNISNNLLINNMINFNYSNSINYNSSNLINNNIKTYKDSIDFTFKNIKINYNKLLNDINNLDNMIIDLKKYQNNNIDISNISHILDKHIFNLKLCLSNFNKDLTNIYSNLDNNIIILNKTTDLIINNNKKKNKCWCFLI